MGYHMAYFVSPHGFGHAARAAAVMEALFELDPTFSFEIFTTVPPWFFHQSLSGPFVYQALLTDIGLVQKSALQEDLIQTAERLAAFLPFMEEEIQAVSNRLQEQHCQLVVCDIAPLGIAAAGRAGIPSVLIENFTWDWIYAAYSHLSPDLTRHILLQPLFEGADYHIQTEPVCAYQKADLHTPPVSRKGRASSNRVRKALHVAETKTVALITLGGVPDRDLPLDFLSSCPDAHFIVPGGSKAFHCRDNLTLLPRRSPFFHPDLINASDAVIGKVGYSTLAEVYHAGPPFGYITRPTFPESRVLAAYIQKEMKGRAITEEAFHNGTWLKALPELLALPRITRGVENGADQIARFIQTI